MRIRSILGALVIAALPFTSVWAENMTPEDIKKLVDEAVTKRLQEHEQREGAMERREPAPPAAQYPVPVGPMTDVKVERPGEEKVPSRSAPLVQDDWSTPSRSSQRRKPLSVDIWIFSIAPRARPVSKMDMDGITNTLTSNDLSRLSMPTLRNM